MEVMTDAPPEIRQQAVDQFKAMMALKPSKQAVKDFLMERATVFLGNNKTMATTRKQRRLAAKMVAKRLTKKVMAGEEII